jgi:hypothetical protein
MVQQQLTHSFYLRGIKMTGFEEMEKEQEDIFLLFILVLLCKKQSRDISEVAKFNSWY